MPPYRFFLSYSWKNRGAPLTRFFDALAEYVRGRVGGELANVAFRDRINVKAGEPWSDELFDALKTSQVLVYLLSIDYIQSDYCGQELQAFLSRIEEFKNENPGVKAPLFIQPVIWVPPAVASLPEVLRQLQPEDDAYPEDYARYGLESLAKQRSRTAFTKCVAVLGDRIIAAAQGDRLPPLSGYTAFEQIPNAFTTGPRQETNVAAAGSGGPTEVKCVYVAASAEELSAQPPDARGNLACYGEDGWYWKPFHPPIPTTVGSVVQQMLAEYRYREVALTDNLDHLIDELRTAADNDQIVLLVVDAWSAFLERYGHFLEKFDTSVLWNNAVIVPRNDCDTDTNANRARLDAKLQLIFRSKYAGMQVSPRFRTDIKNVEEFRSALLGILEMIRAEIETHRAAQLKIQGQPIAQVRTSREQHDAR